MRRWKPREGIPVGGWKLKSKVFTIRKQQLTNDDGHVYAVEESVANQLTFECSTAAHQFEIWQDDLTNRDGFIAGHPPCDCAQSSPSPNPVASTSRGLPVTLYIDREIVDWLKQRAKAELRPLSHIAEETLLAGISALS